VEDPRVSCAQLIYRYAELIDLGDFDGVGDLLDDAEITVEQGDITAKGRDQVREMYTGTTRRYPDDGTPKTKHVMTNVMVELDGPSAASSRSYFTVFQSVPGHVSLQPIVAGRYRHRFELREQGWRIVSKHIIVDLSGELGHHLLIALPEG
jgi:3-phenylpropionate/cinnamic acid dioxygenase small subunit